MIIQVRVWQRLELVHSRVNEQFDVVGIVAADQDATTGHAVLFKLFKRCWYEKRVYIQDHAHKETSVRILGSSQTMLHRGSGFRYRKRFFRRLTIPGQSPAHFVVRLDATTSMINRNERVGVRKRAVKQL